MNAGALNPYLFVVGCPRSGTTLLQRMLDHHPRLTVANDTHFIPRCLERVRPDLVEAASRGAPVPLTPALVEQVAGYHRFNRLGLDERDVTDAAACSTSYAEFVGDLYTRFAASRGKPLGGEKTPDYVRRLPLLCGLFPAARVVHIIRDGRDVALSVLQWADAGKGPGKMELWRTEPIAVCALWWAWQVGSGREASRRAAPGVYEEVCYERLVASPESELRRLSEFLGLPFAESMLTYHEGKVRDDPGLSAKSAWLPPTAGLRDWRTQMDARDVELFEALAGDTLVATGYDRVTSRPSPVIAHVAADSVDWWRAMLSRREEKARRRARRRATI